MKRQSIPYILDLVKGRKCAAKKAGFLSIRFDDSRIPKISP